MLNNIELDKITFALVADALNVKINVGTGYTLSLSGNFKANNDFTIDFDNKTTQVHMKRCKSTMQT